LPKLEARSIPFRRLKKIEFYYVLHYGSGAVRLRSNRVAALRGGGVHRRSDEPLSLQS